MQYIQFQATRGSGFILKPSLAEQYSLVAEDGGIQGRILWCHPFSVQKYVKIKKKRKVFAVNFVVICSKNTWRPKKKVQMTLKTKQNEKQVLYHKSVELWFHIIIWCHPKMVSPGAGRLLWRRLCEPAVFATAIQGENLVFVNYKIYYV